MYLDSFMIARALHVLGVVMWIGGVSMVTTVLLPFVNQFSQTEDKIAFFEKIEKRFAWQARITTFLTGLTGFYMLYLINGWHLYTRLSYWWIHAMTLIWVLFTLMLFVLEPLILLKGFPKFLSNFSHSHRMRVYEILLLQEPILIHLYNVPRLQTVLASEE